MGVVCGALCVLTTQLVVSGSFLERLASLYPFCFAIWILASCFFVSFDRTERNVNIWKVVIINRGRELDIVVFSVPLIML